jgi:predicted HicB family RNase H-like nuclease
MSDPRDTTIRLRVTRTEADRLTAAAQSARESLSDLIRRRLKLRLRGDRDQLDQRRAR